jgi:hypothetical protein
MMSQSLPKSTQDSTRGHTVTVRPFARLACLMAVAALVLSSCGSSSGSNSAPTTSQPSGAGPDLYVFAKCRVGDFRMPTQNVAGSVVDEVGEQVTISDNWPNVQSLSVTDFAIVFYNQGVEVGSVLAGPQQGSQDASTDLYPYPVYLTFGQSQTWTLAAGWSGKATICVVVRFVSSPRVPAGHFATT